MNGPSHSPEEPDFDLDQFRNSKETSAKPAPSKKRQSRHRHRMDGEFLRGPIPLNWLSRACKYGGKVVPTALAIWFQLGRQHGGPIKLTTGLLARFNVGRKAKYAALEALESAGLISVQARRGKNPIANISNLT